MPMTVTWDGDDQLIMRWLCVGNLDWSEYDHAMDAAEIMLNSVSHRVGMIVLAHDFHLPPDTPLHFPAVIRQRYWQHPNLSNTVVVGADHFLMMMIDIFNQTYEGSNVRVVTAQSLEEAYSLLRQEAS